MDLTEKPLTTQNIFNGSFIKVMKDDVLLPDGTTGIREYVKHSGAVAIIAITEDNQIVIERQYRYPVKQLMIEIPAGKLELGEPRLIAAKRELQEETGYYTEDWIELGYCLPCIGYSDEQIHYYLAKDVVLGDAKLDVGEFLETDLIDFEEFLVMAYNGAITDSKTLAGIMLYQGYLRKQ
ncbi:MAG: ADP-ribose pyrophosphatase [Pseudomonadota bacterium]|nr:ADP-ribose pyrophosphatase [Pseudomonadota bacterium]